MKCPKCNNILPNDSVFCQYCGSNLEEITPIPEEFREHKAPGPSSDSASRDAIQEPQPQKLVLQEKKISKAEIKSITKQTSFSRLKRINSPKRGKRQTIISGIFAAVLFLSMFSIIVIQIIQHNNDQVLVNEKNSIIQDLNEENESLRQTISSREDEISKNEETISDNNKTIDIKNNKISSLESKISSLEAKVSSLSTKVDNYTALCSALKNGTIGYAASNFSCTPGIVLVKKGETKKVTLTANWTSGGTVSFTKSSQAATVSFDTNSWTTSTTLSIKGSSEGLCVVTFSNNVDSKTFKLIVVVE